MFVWTHICVACGDQQKKIQRHVRPSSENMVARIRSDGISSPPPAGRNFFVTQTVNYGFVFCKVESRLSAASSLRARLYSEMRYFRRGNSTLGLRTSCCTWAQLLCHTSMVNFLRTLPGKLLLTDTWPFKYLFCISTIVKPNEPITENRLHRTPRK